MYVNGVATGRTISVTSTTSSIVPITPFTLNETDRITFRTIADNGSARGSQIVIGLVIQTDGVTGATGPAGDPATDDQDLSLSGNILSLTGDPTPTPAIDLTPYLDNTDDQTASEVDSDNPVDVDGDGTTEGTVEDVIQDIAPITSKAARIFYPPSIAIDASTISANTAAPGDESINLYQQYIDQYTLANAATSASSTSAPGAIPTYLANELYYYVTFYDPTVFANVEIDDNGVMTYDIIGTPPDFNTLINVVFVVR
ncbi:hypothetical protein [Aquimarina sp. Aq107]|uniref:hypothetical protein n=1 Tax=Aquimarina sp. Aq107 TaxID=1191912 RepID=UPI0020B1D145|nr:hypothetical protein [Aquimarina sp. Aq107]